MTAWSCIIFAAPQNIAGGGVQPLNTDGVNDGVLFSDATPATVTIGDGQNININNNVAGVSATSPSTGSLSFLGTSLTSTVFGTVGVANANKLADISGGLGTSTIIFLGQVVADTFTLAGNGTMQFDSDATGALTFQADGNLVVGAGTTFTGAVANLLANTGTLTLNSGSHLIGAVGAGSALKQVNVVGGDATITGALSATNFSLDRYTLTGVGALALPVNSVLNTTVISDSIFGNINIGAGDSQIAGDVTVNVDASQILSLTGAPLYIVSAGSGTFGRTVTVTSNNIRWSFEGFNEVNNPGDVYIVPTLIPASDLVSNPDAAAVGTVLDDLLPVAAANPDSDLAFIELQLGALPTAAALADALFQIAPASGLLGVNRESFNTTRQFQRVWLEHLQRNRKTCVCFTDNCCNSRQAVYEGPRVWTEGFGYHGHQERKDDFNGYRANTWGTMLAVETPLLCNGLRAGLGVGYASTDLKQRQYGNKTDIDNYQGTVYLNYETACWFIDGGFSFGWNHYDGKRHISFGAVDRTAHAEYDGQAYTGFAVAGYQRYYNCFEITPLASLLYTHLVFDDYTETGADSLNLHVNKQHYDYLESGLGLKIAYLLKARCGTYIPEVHSLWLHDFYDNGLDVTASFTGIGAVGGDFTNTGPRFDRNTGNIGGSITFVANNNWSIQLLYDYERSSSYFDHQGLIQLTYDF